MRFSRIWRELSLGTDTDVVEQHRTLSGLLQSTRLAPNGRTGQPCCTQRSCAAFSSTAARPVGSDGRLGKSNTDMVLPFHGIRSAGQTQRTRFPARPTHGIFRRCALHNLPSTFFRQHFHASLYPAASRASNTRQIAPQSFARSSIRSRADNPSQGSTLNRTSRFSSYFPYSSSVSSSATWYRSAYCC